MSKGSVMALDVGNKRIGVALASIDARLPSPLTTLENNDNFIKNLTELIKEHKVAILVVGLPRGLEGQETEQTHTTIEFTQKLKAEIKLPIRMQDEAVTSLQARKVLDDKGKAYSKEDIDAMAAAIILQDFIEQHSEEIEKVSNDT